MYDEKASNSSLKIISTMNDSVEIYRSHLFVSNLFFATTKRHDDEERDVVAPPRRRNLLGWSTLFNFVRRSWNGILADRQEGGPFVIWAPMTNLQASLLFPALPEEDPKTLPRRANGWMWGRWWTPLCFQRVWFMRRFIATYPTTM